MDASATLPDYRARQETVSMTAPPICHGPLAAQRSASISASLFVHFINIINFVLG